MAGQSFNWNNNINALALLEGIDDVEHNTLWLINCKDLYSAPSWYLLMEDIMLICPVIVQQVKWSPYVKGK